MTTRRDFLRTAAATPLIFGLSGCSRPPAWFHDALRTLRAEGKPGLVVRLPRDAAARCRLGHQVAGLGARDDVDALQVAYQAVVLCLEDEAARRKLDGLRAGEELLLIDADGTVLDGRSLDPDGDLVDGAATLLDGPQLRRLRARAAEARRTAPPEALAAFERLKKDGDAAGMDPWAAALLPLLVELHRDTVNSGAEDVIRTLAPPSRLPYGTSIATGVRSRCEEDPSCTWGGACLACGLAVVTPQSRSFVKFLAG